jgi:hypothetical protein
LYFTHLFEVVKENARMGVYKDVGGHGIYAENAKENYMNNFFVKTFIKNPIGLIVLGILATIIIGPAVSEQGGGPTWYIMGIVISVIGILWLVRRIKRAQRAIAANLPLYLKIVDALEKSGYEIQEFEHKWDRVRSNVLLKGKLLGEVFLVAPPPSGRYAQFRRRGHDAEGF